MSYRKIYEALKAYEPKRLVRNVYACLEGRCAIGALVSAPEALPDKSVETLYYARHPMIMKLVTDFECTVSELEKLQYYNDSGDHKTHEERYRNVLDYLEKHLFDEGA